MKLKPFLQRRKQTKARLWPTIVAGVALVIGTVGANPVPLEAANTSPKIDVLIGFTHTPGASEQALVRGQGGVIKQSYHLVPAMAASIPEAAMTALMHNPRVTDIDLDGAFYAVDAELDNSWGVQRIGSGIVHEGGNKGSGVKVAIIDSGIDYSHPDLGGCFGSACKVSGGYDFVNNDTNPMDDNGHGTHVAGTVAASDDGLGVVGVAPEASLSALKVLAANGSGSFSGVIAALEWAVDHGIQVTNNSYGSSSDPGSIVKAAFDNSAAAGILHIAAAGNSGTRSGKGNNVGYPARYDSVVAVAATDKNDNRATFSSTGPAVELSAPGVGINSTRLGGGYVEYNGTSMASPHVAGTAALVIAAGAGNASEVRQILDSTAGDLGAAGRDNLYGFGLVDAVSSVLAAIPLPAGTISGTVRDAGTSAPISGAHVADGVRSATTDGNGVYTLPDVPVGVVTLTASAVGYQSASQSVTVTEGVVSLADFSLQAATQATSVSVDTIAYATEGGKNGDRHLIITVALVDNLGEAVSGASVAADFLREGSLIGSATDLTDSTGKVTFSYRNAPSGYYETRVTSVSAAGLVWDGATPPNGFTK